MAEDDLRGVESEVAKLRLELETSDYDDDDELSEEEEEGEEAVLLGFVEKAKHAWSLSRQVFPSKAGGAPAWLDPVNIPKGKDMCCEICENPLRFLLQVYAPIDGKDEAFHRILFVFVCPSMACLQQDQLQQKRPLESEKPKRCVKAFRCQLPRKNDFYSINPPRNDGTDIASIQGVPLCSWCGTWRGEKICGGCKKTRYCSRNHQVEHWKASHASICRQLQASSLVNSENIVKEIFKDGANNGVTPLPALTHSWPEFEINVEEEEGHSDSEIAGGDSKALMVRPMDDSVEKGFQDIQEASKEQKAWANFQARLAQAPSQVLRYCRSVDAKPLWPRIDEKPQVSNIPACHLCSSPRIFEFQVMPQLLYFFGVSNEKDAFDWSTIGVFSCEHSCLSSEGYVEEFVWVQLPP